MIVPIAPVCLVSATFSIIVGILLYGRNPRDPINRVVLLLSGLLFYWGFTEFQYFQAADIQSALLWMRLGGFWYLTPALVFHFSMIYAGVKLDKRLLYMSTWMPATFASILEASGSFFEPTRVPWGWDLEYNFVGSLARIWAVLISCAALVVLFTRYRRARTPEEKTGAVFVLLGFLIPIALGSVFGAILPLFVSAFPDVTMPGTAIGFFLIGYAVLRYGTYVLTPITATEDILSTMPDALFLLNRDGEIIASNRAASKLLEYENSELVGTRMGSHMQNSATKDLLSFKPENSFEAHLTTKRGDSVPVSVSKSVVKTKSGTSVGYILICHDITARREMERQLLNSARLATIGKTTSMVSHDLRNPLQAIIGATGILRERLDQPDNTTRKMLDLIEESIRRSDQIVNDLLDYSRELSLHIAESNPRTVVENALSRLTIPGNIEIVNLATSEPRIRVDMNRLERVFINLIQNAFDAMSEGGKLTISSMQSEGNVEISFTDTGMGMTEQTARKVGTPLFTTKTQGMGLGVAICKRILEAHKGSLLIQSAPDKGSTFTVKLRKAPDLLQPSPLHIPSNQRIQHDRSAIS
jgi:PAS domain S-box-containing protein